MHRLYRKIADKLLSYAKGAIIVNSKFGKKTYVSKRAYISNSNLNDYTSIGRNTTITNAILGKYCSISWNVTIGATMHPMDRISTHAFVYISKFGFAGTNERIKIKTEIGNDVWIGANAIIMPGLTIGDGAIIGAGAIVTKSVPDYAIVIGAPAKIVRFRFSKTEIVRLQNLKWWDMSPQIIKENLSLWKESLDEKLLNRLETICKS